MERTLWTIVIIVLFFIFSCLIYSRTRPFLKKYLPQWFAAILSIIISIVLGYFMSILFLIIVLLIGMLIGIIPLGVLLQNACRNPNCINRRTIMKDYIVILIMLLVLTVQSFIANYLFRRIHPFFKKSYSQWSARILSIMISVAAVFLLSVAIIFLGFLICIFTGAITLDEQSCRFK